VVLVARGENVLLRKGYGYAERSFKNPFTPKTKVRIASLTKQFTAAAILKLQDEGKLSVDDPVCRHIRPCPDAWAPVTLHHLLTHTAGVPELLTRSTWANVSRWPATPRELTEQSAALPLQFEPGTRFRYSNGGYNLLGDVVERVSRRPYDAYLREAFFEPLGMADTGYADERTVREQFAQGYDGPRLLPEWRHASVIFSAGGLYSTADDLRTWTRALHSGRVISREGLERMTGRTGAFAEPSTRKRSGVPLLYAYGISRGPLGLQVEPGFGDEQVFHTGSWYGFRLLLTHAPAQDATVVVLSNRIDQHQAVRLISQKGMALALGRPDPQRLAPYQPPPAEAAPEPAAVAGKALAETAPTAAVAN
jgi:CubicO group peptidase (beta-lactamase class C family)